jgi:hypothetical protein
MIVNFFLSKSLKLYENKFTLTQAKNAIVVLIFIIISSCSTWSHRSGNNSNLDTDKRYCNTEARIQAPTYICRNPLMCAPDEFAIAIDALSRNAAVFDRCMMQKGYN